MSSVVSSPKDQSAWNPKGSEFELSAREFKRIQALAFSLTGITLSDHKRSMIYGRLSRRLRRLGLHCFSDYCDLVEHQDCDEVTEFINAITTNLTAFFRESHHFDFLKEQAIPEILQKNAETKRLRIWSAGCSTGEEPYSIAMTLRSFPQLSSWDAKILATDLDTNVLAKGKQGIYAGERVNSVPAAYRSQINETASGDVEMRDSLKELITFKPLNLLGKWPMRGSFDLIFCRNVVIYFNTDTQRTLFDRYANILTAEGYLIIGHSESLHNVTDRFAPKGRTVYQRLR